MKELREYYEKNDLISFRNILSESSLAQDSFVQKYSKSLVEEMSRTWIEKSCDIYTIMKIDYIQNIIQKNQHETELILRELIVSGKINATINQLKNILIINRDYNEELSLINEKKYLQFQMFTKRYIQVVDQLNQKISNLDNIKLHKVVTDSY